MSTLGEFKRGDQVFIYYKSEWMGFEIVGTDLESSIVYLKVVWTNGVPGYIYGDSVVLDDGTEAYGILTVAIVTENP